MRVARASGGSSDPVGGRVPVASSSRKLTLNLGSKLGVYIDTPPLYPNPIPHPVQWRFFLRQTLLAAAAAAGERERIPLAPSLRRPWKGLLKADAVSAGPFIAPLA